MSDKEAKPDSEMVKYILANSDKIEVADAIFIHSLVSLECDPEVIVRDPRTDCIAYDLAKIDDAEIIQKIYNRLKK